jgi:hypothetical protein
MVTRRWVAAALAAMAAPVLVGSCNAIFGIEPFEVYQPGPDGGTPDTGKPDSGEPDADAGPMPEVCDASFDLEGCVCATLSAVRDCHHGVPGPTSACNTPGQQQCSIDGETMRWGACNGGSMPSAEQCYDLVDNDCDGVVDQGCPGTDDFDLCKATEAGMPSMSAYNFFTIPAAPKAGQPFQGFILSGQPLNSPSIALDMSCYGQGFAVACPPGAGCQGWNALRLPFPGGVAAGMHTLDLRVNDTGATPCLPQPTATWMFDVAP